MKYGTPRKDAITFKMKIEILAVFFVILFSSLAAADVVSINSGSSTNIAITPDKYIEGFFFPPVCGNGVIEISEQCEPGDLNGETCASQGFSSGTLSCSSSCTFDTSACTSGGTTTSGGGGGGGGAAAAATSNILLNPSEFNINLAVNTTVEKTVSVQNLGTSQITVSISQESLGGHIIFNESSLTLAAGETKNLKVTFVASSEPGIYAGNIVVGGNKIPVSINVKTQLLLFDSNIIVLNDNYQVNKGGKLKTKVTLIPIGDQERLDVTLNYVIKDYNGTVYLTKGETVLVKNQESFERDFDTGALPLGDYIIGLELVYPNGIAPSSAHFYVIPAAFFSLGTIALYLIILILIISIMIVILLIMDALGKRRRK